MKMHQTIRKNLVLCLVFLIAMGCLDGYSQRVKVRMFPAKKPKKNAPVVGSVDYANDELAYGVVLHRKRKALIALPHKIKNFKPTGEELILHEGKTMRVDGFKVNMWRFYTVTESAKEYHEWQNGLLMISFGRGPSKDYGAVGVFIDSTMNVEPARLLTSVDLHGLYNVSIFKYTPSHEIKVENDHMVIEFEIDRWAGEKGLRDFTILDKDLKIVQQNQYREKKLAKAISVEDRYISKTGDYVIVARVFNRKKGEKKNLKSTWPYQIIRFRPGQKKPEKISYDFGDKYLGSVKLIEFQGELALAGIYGEKKRSFDGLWFATLDPETFEITHQTSRSFASISMSEMEGEEGQAEEEEAPTSRTKGKKNKLQGAMRRASNIRSPKIPITRIIENPDGTAYVIGEEQWETVHCNKEQCYTNYHNGRLIVIFLNAEREALWTRSISKYGQVHYPDGDYNYFECSQGPLLVIDEHSAAPSEVDFPMKKIKTGGVFHKGKVSAILLKPDGNLDKFTLINNHQKKVHVSPYNMYQADEDIFFFGYNKKKNIGVGRIEIKF